MAWARDLTVVRGARTVLAQFSVALPAGEIYVLLGPNGSGKTTLVQALCGYLAAASGSVRVDGADPRRSAAARRRIGLVPQDIALYPSLTTRENVAYLGRVAGLGRALLRSRVEQVLEECRLAEVALRPVQALSGGYQRRVNLAAALVARPALLLMDEPTVGIDRDASVAICEVLKAQRAAGVAILLISHDLEQAAALADRVGVLAAGRLIREGRLAEVLGDTGSLAEIVVIIERSPQPGERALLASLGLATRGDPLVWNAAASSDAPSLDGLRAALRAGGLPVREISLRRRGLVGAYEDLVREVRP